ncbi:MAG: hypothetical protein LBE46_01010 [Wolbachia pipientis]|nr:hypothetical protein [Wolbachia pipientis]
MKIASFLSSQCLLLLSFQCSFFCHPSSPFLLSQCPDTGSLYNGSAPFLSSQCPDTGIQVAHKQTRLCEQNFAMKK